MQLIKITLRSEVPSDCSNERMTELTSAVLPVPGVPEMYKEVGAVLDHEDVINSRMRCRSSSRQAIGDRLVLAERRSPRARVYIGSSETEGVGGGVEITKAGKGAVGVLGTLATVEVDERLQASGNSIRIV